MIRGDMGQATQPIKTYFTEHHIKLHKILIQQLPGLLGDGVRHRGIGEERRERRQELTG
jgi:hypothetical protein